MQNYNALRVWILEFMYEIFGMIWFSGSLFTAYGLTFMIYV